MVGPTSTCAINTAEGKQKLLFIYLFILEWAKKKKKKKNPNLLCNLCCATCCLLGFNDNLQDLFIYLFSFVQCGQGYRNS